MPENLSTRLLALGLGLILAGFLGEAVLRVSNTWVGRHSDTMFTVIEHDPRLGWRMRPGLAAKVSFVDREGIPVRANRWGFWDRDWREVKPEGTCRIAVLGDSFAWGMGVEESQRFSNQLATQAPGLDVTNLAMPGYGTDQELLAWEEIAQTLDPDVVVLTIYQNDLTDNHFEIRNGRSKPYFLVVGGRLERANYPAPDLDFWQTGILHRVAAPYRDLYPQAELRRNRVIQWLAKHSDLTRLLYTLSRTRREPTLQPESTTRLEAPVETRELSQLERAQVRLLMDLVAELQRQVELANGKLAIIVSGDPIPQVKTVLDSLREGGLPVLDATTEALRSDLGKQQTIYFHYNRHWTAAAHALVAHRLRALLEREQLCSETVRITAGAGG